ncbi:hypothetical protein KJ032_27175, partial [Salmonella enterica subsp. enterica serovar Typhimurium]|nr:hypothetical protein [Salmonella enterica subsp. enterica serovar Typhimurium]
MCSTCASITFHGGDHDGAGDFSDELSEDPSRGVAFEAATLRRHVGVPEVSPYVFQHPKSIYDVCFLK